jgi:hypothetical protein
MAKKMEGNEMGDLGEGLSAAYVCQDNWGVFLPEMVYFEVTR